MMRPRIPDRDPDLLVVAIGEAKGAGSKNARVVTRWDAEKRRRVPIIDPITQMPKVHAVDSSGAKGKDWRRAVAEAGNEAMHDFEIELMVECAIAVEFVFFRGPHPGPISKRTDGPTDAARLYPHKRPDVLKLARAAEDALTGVVWKDDAQIVREILEKSYGVPERLEARVWRLETTYRELRAQEAGEQAALTL